VVWGRYAANGTRAYPHPRYGQNRNEVSGLRTAKVSIGPMVRLSARRNETPAAATDRGELTSISSRPYPGPTGGAANLLSRANLATLALVAGAAREVG